MNHKYSVGGVLSEDDPTYVTRSADEQLYNGLKEGKFCYVLNSRQTGKSSLRVQVMKRLRLEGWKCAVLDLAMLGTQSTIKEWYADILSNLTASFNLDIDLSVWIRKNNYLSPLQRLKEFIELILLIQIEGKVAIFLDEIDSVLSLGFSTDDFFAFIRSCYHYRTENQAFDRLTFCLLGVATPSALIRDKKRTPFNIGVAINLSGLQFEEAQSKLIPGLANFVDDSRKILKDILKWTGGQPFFKHKSYVILQSRKLKIVILILQNLFKSL